LTRAALRTASLVVANGQYLANQTAEIAGSTPVLPLYLGVDTNELLPGTPGREATVICTRGFLPVYNNPYLIAGIAAWTPRAPANLRVVFTSPGPQLDDARAYADRTLGEEMRARVEFLGGVTRDKMMSELQRSHVYVSLSRSDGTSISLLEALACGVFPVLSDLPQNREWVTKEEDNGILVPFDRPDLLADALDRAFADANWRERATTYNRQKVVELANSAATMQRLVEALKLVAMRQLLSQQSIGSLLNA
jgi:glycosyltransferase involved in cell wall biosynthesis